MDDVTVFVLVRDDILANLYQVVFGVGGGAAVDVDESVLFESESFSFVVSTFPSTESALLEVRAYGRELLVRDRLYPKRWVRAEIWYGRRERVCFELKPLIVGILSRPLAFCRAASFWYHCSGMQA